MNNKIKTTILMTLLMVNKVMFVPLQCNILPLTLSSK